MDTAVRTTLSATTAITSVSPVPRFPSNTAIRPYLPKTIASTLKSTPKPHSPQNIGLVGPICWRKTSSSQDLQNVNTSFDLLDTDSSQSFALQEQYDNLDGVDGQDRLPRHSDSSHTFSSEENDISDLEQSDNGQSQKNLYRIQGQRDEEQGL